MFHTTGSPPLAPCTEACFLPARRPPACAAAAAAAAAAGAAGSAATPAE